MLNLIPALMLLLVQGAGPEMGLRHHQALLDLAHRVVAAEDREALESLVNGNVEHEDGSVDLLVQILAGCETAPPQVEIEEKPTAWVPAPPEREWSPEIVSVGRTRDGPVFA